MPGGKGTDPKKLLSELQATNEQLNEELEATKAELVSIREKLNTVAVKMVEAADQK